MIIDVDHRNGGWEGLAQLENAHGSLPVTIKVRTGSGGLHLVFVHPGRNLRGGASRLGRGVDVLADGQFAVGVGSRHASGGTYVSTGSAIIGTCSVPRGKPARTGGRSSGGRSIRKLADHFGVARERSPTQPSGSRGSRPPAKR